MNVVVVAGVTLNEEPDVIGPTTPLSTVTVVPVPLINTGVISTESFRVMVVDVAAVRLMIDGAGSEEELPPQEASASSDNKQTNCVRERNV